MNDLQERPILVELRGDIGIVTINRPKALNALNAATLRELDAAITALGRDDTVRVVIVTGSGEKAFVAGADVVEMQAMSPAEARSFARFGQAVFCRIEKLRCPVIAAVNGFALGGGCELALACDIRVAAENARFGQPETGLGITPGFGGTQRLPRLVGLGRAKEMLFTADSVHAAEALHIGLVNQVVPPGHALEAAIALAKRIVARSPVAVAHCKTAVAAARDAGPETGMGYEAEVFALCFADTDQREGMRAFTEKRPPAFAGGAATKH